jgi:pilus assembly protein Flp/PilA
MLKLYIQATEALKSLRSDVAGVVSFEYVIVAACVVAAVAAAFGTDAASGIGLALKNAIDAIALKVTTAVG